MFFALVSVGCTHDYPLITSLPAPETPPAGAVMLVMSGTPPTARIQQPGFMDRGGENRFERPIATGTQMPSARPPDVSGVVAGATAAGFIAGRSPAAGATGFGVGLALGAGLVVATGVIVATARQNTETVLRTFGEMPVAEALVNEILQAGRSHRILPPAAAGTDTVPPAVDTFLALEGPRVSLSSTDTTVWSPDLQLRVARVAVVAKLLRASDREELARWTWEHIGPTTNLAEWSQDDARLFRTETAGALRALAPKLVSDIAPDPVQAVERR